MHTVRKSAVPGARTTAARTASAPAATVTAWFSRLLCLQRLRQMSVSAAAAADVAAVADAAVRIDFAPAGMLCLLTCCCP